MHQALLCMVISLTESQTGLFIPALDYIVERKLPNSKELDSELHTLRLSINVHVCKVGLIESIFWQSIKRGHSQDSNGSVHATQVDIRNPSLQH